ncbi:ABC transporter substrate-binding protein [Reyranella massiliensis]|uniref:ABC transporter substrate-binding protein n=1 Tax=Reyranella massiliensis TaxID=445220 RepID=UPI0002FE2F38|nr:ABC transporter substrate-binding protein [Reyranella massiliensis]
MSITRRRFPLVAGAALALAAKPALAANPVRIGALYPLSGQVAKSGEDTLNGIRLAVDIINKKYPHLKMPLAVDEGLPGLGGAPIELIAADHQGSPETGAAEAERLIVQRKVAALVGAFHSSVAATSSQVAERMGVPYLSGESEATPLTERGYRWFFRTTPSSRTQARDFFTFLRDINKTSGGSVKSISVVHESTLWGQEFAKSVDAYFSEFPEFKKSIVVGYQQGTADVTSEVQRLIAAKPDAVFHASYDAEAILFARTYKQYGFNPQGIMAIGASFGSSAFRDALGPDANYFFVREHWSRDLAARNPLVGEIAKMYRERYGKEMDGTPARAFTAMMVLADAVNRAKSADPEKIRDALAATDIKGDALIMPWEGVKFDKTGQNVLTRGIFVQTLDGTPKMVWPADFAAAKLVWPRPAWR